MRAFEAYHPRNGIHINSFLVTKQLSGSQANWANTSNMHWCLGAISARPFGMNARPRNSTRIPQTRRNNSRMPNVQMRQERTIQIRGASASGEIISTKKSDQT